jgi:hypothetical protein
MYSVRQVMLCAGVSVGVPSHRLLVGSGQARVRQRVGAAARSRRDVLAGAVFEQCACVRVNRGVDLSPAAQSVGAFITLQFDQAALATGLVVIDVGNPSTPGVFVRECVFVYARDCVRAAQTGARQ